MIYVCDSVLKMNHPKMYHMKSLTQIHQKSTMITIMNMNQELNNLLKVYFKSRFTSIDTDLIHVTKWISNKRARVFGWKCFNTCFLVVKWILKNIRGHTFNDLKYFPPFNHNHRSLKILLPPVHQACFILLI